MSAVLMNLVLGSFCNEIDYQHCIHHAALVDPSIHIGLTMLVPFAHTKETSISECAHRPNNLPTETGSLLPAMS